MQYNTFKGTSYIGGSITNKGERLVYCKITADIHTSHQLHQSALELIYSDALLAGSGNLSRVQFIDALNALGASISVHINNSTFSITLKTLKENLPKVLILLETMMQKPTFTANEIRRIKRQIKNELIEAKEDSRSIAVEKMVNTLYTQKDRRYSESPDNLSKTLPSISKKDLQMFHKNVINSLWYVTIGGDKTTVEKIKTAIEVCKKGSKGAKVVKKVHEQKQPKAQLLLQDIPSKQNIDFSIGSTLPVTLRHPDYIPFVFGLSVLGKWGGFTGRLMSTVREKEGLTYMIYARTETVSGTEQGYWRITTFFSPKQALQGIKSTVREIQLMQSKGITKTEFTRFQEILKTQQMLLGDSFTGSIDELHGYICEGFDLTEMHTFKQQLHTVRLAEVNKALKRYLTADALIVSGAGPVATVSTQIKKFL